MKLLPDRPRICHLIPALLLGTQVVQGIEVNLDDPHSIKNAAKVVASELMSYYTGYRPGDNPGNLPDPYFWWEAGAMFGAMIDYWAFTGDSTWNNMTIQALLWQAGPTGNFMPSNQTMTEGNDDQAFWGMAAMSAAERNFPNPPADKPQWLAMAQGVFNSQAARWDTSTCSGGLRWQIFTWNNGFNYKNTISNGGFFNIASRLAKYTRNQTYADWAEKSWQWTRDVGFMTPDYRFWDGADDNTNCSNFNQIQWTYNSGIYLLGAANMYNFTNGSDIWKERTLQILNATSVFFSENVMYERACESVGTCQVDQKSFKAYFARWMTATTQMAPFTYDLIMPKIRASALAAAKTCTGGPNGTSCGMKWTEQNYDGSTGVGEQMSALEVLQSNLIQEVLPPFTNSTGGTSKGDPSAGSGGDNLSNKVPVLKEITTMDRAGAGILTTVFLSGILGCAGWMVIDK
ncbi:putative cell wall glycosyl hydrolase Dfg5 [Talaromyces proteolyticus]|uniref:Mannan endo-1,6-alpha-mannosidase n=1 Tax=Talaromyces proteolyticus TaxID=1131652 RepID=A0AAD4PRX0_9EURO|nr:putative cell wall glycosyl hydrolase Dfg5 [Talaromyces proteolyticus]KAH8689980.1 putative cell wall glycosyl hydrolase Dfg5 [Talaromyces proteolyticus]